MRRAVALPSLVCALLVAACGDAVSPPEPVALRALTRSGSKVVTPSGVTYTAEEIPNLGGRFASAHSINENGQAFGYSETADGSSHAYFWENGVTTDITPFGGNFVDAEGMNQHGAVTGYSSTSDPDSWRGFIWRAGVMTDLGTLPGHTNSWGQSVNDSGVVGATSCDITWVFCTAAIWRNGALTALPTLGGAVSSIWEINNAGLAVGVSERTDGIRYPVVWKDGALIELDPGVGGEALAVNEAGQVAGYSSRVFRWENGVMTWLPQDAGYPTAIATNGDIIGYSADGLSRPFSWHNGDLVRLPVPDGLSDAQPWSINDAGQIAGMAFDRAARKSHALLWENGVVIDLGALAGGSYAGIAFGHSINNAGQIVGYAQNAAGNDASVIWQPTLPELAVSIDIKPGANPNTLNPRSNGTLQVALLGSAAFAVADVDASSVKFGAGNAPPIASPQTSDANGDGIPDLVFKFSTPSIAIVCGDTSVTLTGLTTGNRKFRGSDAVVTTGCH